MTLDKSKEVDRIMADVVRGYYLPSGEHDPDPKEDFLFLLALVKRHEAALEELFSSTGAINKIMREHNFEQYMLTRLKCANEPAAYYIHFDESEPDDNEEEFCFYGETPLAAIEAAMNRGEKP